MMNITTKNKKVMTMNMIKKKVEQNRYSYQNELKIVYHFPLIFSFLKIENNLICKSIENI